MIVLIDESGDPGFKLTKGATPYFVVAMVIFKDYIQAEAASKVIAEMRQSLRVNPEFKFHNTRPEVKKVFFETICQYDFEVRALVVNKKEIYSSRLRTNADNFYNYFVKTLLKYDQDVLSHASVKIDGSGDKEFKRVLGTYLRKEISAEKIIKFKFVDSKKDSLIQLADMVVGAIARSYSEQRKDAQYWLDMLKKERKIKNIWAFAFE